MDHAFWHDKWQANQIGFHQPHPNGLLTRHLSALCLPAGARLFLPLCGKTLDIHWLHQQGFHVIGAELSELAITQLFDEMALTPRITRLDHHICYSAPRLDLYVGDIFDLTADQTGPIDAIYDRAALVALPGDMRPRYAAHLATLSQRAPQLLITFTYDQTAMQGPPFSIDADAVAHLTRADYTRRALETVEVPGGLKGRCPATATAWHLRAR